MPNPTPVSQPLLNQFQTLLNSQEVKEEELLALIQDLQKLNLAEAAMLSLRQARMGTRFPAFRRALEAAAHLSRSKRAALWHLGGERVHLRLKYAKLSPLQELNAASTLALLERTLSEAGFALVLGLEKKSRPLITLGHPLAIGTEGLEEWADAVLQQRPEGAPKTWLSGLNKVAPEGLVFGGLEMMPPYALPVLNLSREAHWAWSCPPDYLLEAKAHVLAFLAASTFELEKQGKAEGAKILKKVDVRPLVKSAYWEGFTLVVLARIAPGEALNPRKLLGAMLGLDPGGIEGLVRRCVVLAEDPRLKQAEKFEPKLKNIFEDAVLLGEGSNLILVDEDEGEPLILG